MPPSLCWSRDEASHCLSTANSNSPPASSASSLPQALGVGRGGSDKRLGAAHSHAALLKGVKSFSEMLGAA